MLCHETNAPPRRSASSSPRARRSTWSSPA